MGMKWVFFARFSRIFYQFLTVPINKKGIPILENPLSYQESTSGAEPLTYASHPYLDGSRSCTSHRMPESIPGLCQGIPGKI